MQASHLHPGISMAAGGEYAIDDLVNPMAQELLKLKEHRFVTFRSIACKDREWKQAAGFFVAADENEGEGRGIFHFEISGNKCSR